MSPEVVGEYKILSKLGKGAFGDVFKVQHIHNARFCALKEVKITTKFYTEQITKEVDSHKAIPVHENVVAFLDHIETKNRLYIVIELCELGTLEDYVLKNRPDRDVILSFMLDMAKGLNHLHSNNVVHRDIKPENVLLTKGPHGIPKCKLSDFGVSKMGASSPEEAKAGSLKGEEYFNTICGTPAFLAPEVQNKHYTRSCDIFSLGLVFFSLHSPKRKDNRLGAFVQSFGHGMTREIPFFLAGQTQIESQIKKDIKDADIRDLVSRMVNVDYKSRISIADVEQILSSMALPDDEVFIVTCVFFAVLVMILLLPLPLLVLVLVLIALAFWEFAPKNTFRKIYM